LWKLPVTGNALNIIQDFKCHGRFESLGFALAFRAGGRIKMLRYCAVIMRHAIILY